MTRKERVRKVFEKYSLEMNVLKDYYKADVGELFDEIYNNLEKQFNK